MRLREKKVLMVHNNVTSKLKRKVYKLYKKKNYRSEIKLQIIRLENIFKTPLSMRMKTIIINVTRLSLVNRSFFTRVILPKKKKKISF